VALRSLSKRHRICPAAEGNEHRFTTSDVTRPRGIADVGDWLAEWGISNAQDDFICKLYSATARQSLRQRTARLQVERLHRPTNAGALFDPVEKLGEAVDLIIITSIGKLQQFGAEILEPSSLPRQMDLAGFDAR
jgi:hypothetical protein